MSSNELTEACARAEGAYSAAEEACGGADVPTSSADQAIAAADVTSSAADVIARPADTTISAADDARMSATELDHARAPCAGECVRPFPHEGTKGTKDSLVRLTSSHAAPKPASRREFWGAPPPPPKKSPGQIFPLRMRGGG